MATMFVIPETEILRIPADAHTLAGFHAWTDSPDFPERGRVEYCEGEVLVDMSSERLDSHVAVKDAVYRRLSNFIIDHDLGLFCPDGAGFANEPADLSTQPDALFASWKSLDSGAAHKGDADEPRYIWGSPDWILEIVSPSSVQKDKTRWVKKYAEAGVREYWVIDARSDEIGFDLLVLGANGYAPQQARDGWRHSPVFATDVRLTRSDRRGHPFYNLELRAEK